MVVGAWIVVVVVGAWVLVLVVGAWVLVVVVGTWVVVVVVGAGVVSTSTNVLNHAVQLHCGLGAAKGRHRHKRRRRVVVREAMVSLDRWLGGFSK